VRRLLLRPLRHVVSNAPRHVACQLIPCMLLLPLRTQKLLHCCSGTVSRCQLQLLLRRRRRVLVWVLVVMQVPVCSSCK
jgi:hypothetical protein